MVVVAAKQLREGYAGAAETAPRKPRLRVVRDCKDDINPFRGTMLRQARQYYDPLKISSLKDSLEINGLFNAIEIALLSEPAARYYIRVWNWVWGTRYKLSDISQGPDGRYEIVVAGHCRKLAGMGLYEEGREPADWQIKFLPEITPEAALERQMQENIHSRPETWEDADAVYRNWRLLKRLDCDRRKMAKQEGKLYVSTLTIPELARKVGRSESAVRGYVLFGSAPKILQTAVRKGQLAYGKGLLLAMAVNAGIISTERLQNHWLPLATLPGQSVETFEKAMEGRINAARNRQEDLFGDLDAESVAKALENDRRAIVFPDLIERIYQNISYSARVRELDEAGLLGGDGPYSAASPNRAFLAFITELERTLPHMRKLADEQRQRSERVIAEAGALLGELGPEPSPESILSLL